MRPPPQSSLGTVRDRRNRLAIPPFLALAFVSLFSIFLNSRRQAAFFGDTPFLYGVGHYCSTNTLASISFLGFRFPVSRMMDTTIHFTAGHELLTTHSHTGDDRRPPTKTDDDVASARCRAAHFTSSTADSIREKYSTWSDTGDFATWTGLQ